MGFFSAVGQTIGRIFGTDKALDSAVSSLSSGLDKLIYTKQEKAESTERDNSEARAFIIEWMKSTTGQNMSRRLIALSLTFTWLSMFFYCALLSAVKPFIFLFVDGTTKILVGGEYVEIATATLICQAMADSVEAIGGYAMGMTGAMMLVLGFYFAASHMGGIVGNAMQMFSGSFKKK